MQVESENTYTAHQHPLNQVERHWTEVNHVTREYIITYLGTYAAGPLTPTVTVSLAGTGKYKELFKRLENLGVLEAGPHPDIVDLW